MIKIQKVFHQTQRKFFSCRFKYLVARSSYSLSTQSSSAESRLAPDELPIGPEFKKSAEPNDKFLIFPIKNVLFPHSSYFTRISSSQHELLSRLKIQYVAAFLSKEALKSQPESIQGEVSVPSDQEPGPIVIESVAQLSEGLEPSVSEKVKKSSNFPMNTRGGGPRSKKYRDAMPPSPDSPDDNDIHHIIIYDDNITMHYGQNIEILDADGKLKAVTDESLFDVPKLKSISDIYSLGVMCKLTLQALPAESPDKKPENFAILKSLYRLRLIDEVKDPNAIKDLIINNTIPTPVGGPTASKPFKNRQFYLKKEEMYKRVFDNDEKKEGDLSSENPTIEEDLNQIMSEFKFGKVFHLYSSPNISEKTLTETFHTKLSTLIGYYTKLRLKVQINIPELFIMPDDPRVLDIICGFLSATSFFGNQQLQTLLEVLPVKDRLDLCLKFFMRYEKHFLSEWDSLEKSSTLPLDPNTQRQQYQDMYNFLKRSSENPYKKPIVEKIKQNMANKKFPPEIFKLINDDLSRFSEMQESHPDYNIYRSFLELITSLPFGVHSQDNFDIKQAKQILDEDHFGLEDVKDRILEFIAVAKLKGNIRGKSLLLVGPPGVGKTSIGTSVAKCLNRKFSRISLGGEYDVSILKGHRKTYIGAYPGKIVQALKITETENPVILLDEVDKLGQGMRGNLQDALLEVLDPVQNSKFTDHFLDTPIDLSNVLFLCTANLMDTIHPALLDRMEVIQLSGYTKEEKKQILLRYLFPKALDSAGLKENYANKINLTDSAVDKLLLSYSREAGVRNLERLIKRICEKLSLKFLTQKDETIIIDSQNLHEYVGLPIFSDQRLYENTPPPGVVIGLAYNSYGGSIIFIEAIQSNFEALQQTSNGPESEPKTDSLNISGGVNIRKGGLKFTGSLGDVMQESIQIAYTYAKTILNNYFSNDWLEVNDVHIHFPEGATKKDGPSAGVAITTSLISLALNKQMSDVIAMTGEMSLTGKVLKIGGVKEKVLAAKRENIKKLIFPLGNKQDVEELKDYIKEGIRFDYAETYDDVMYLVFPGLMQRGEAK